MLSAKVEYASLACVVPYGDRAFIACAHSALTSGERKYFTNRYMPLFSSSLLLKTIAPRSHAGYHSVLSPRTIGATVYSKPSGLIYGTPAQEPR